jgi:hypothetical protein
MKYVEIEFRCQRCGHLFIEEEREFCDAPPTTTALARQKIQAIHESSKTGEYLSPIDKNLANALNDIIGTQPQSQEERENARKIIITKLRGAYADMILVEAEKLGISFQEAKDRGVITESMDDFVQRNLALIDASQPKVEEHVQEPVEDNSVKEREYRLDWARKKLAGKQPTKTVEEYVKRRLAGEVFS